MAENLQDLGATFEPMNTSPPAGLQGAQAGSTSSLGLGDGASEPLTAAGRARSSSPWRFQLSAKASPISARLRNAESNLSTPSGKFSLSSSSRTPTAARATSVVQAAARASYESALLAAVRRQIEAFEEKVTTQLNRIQSQSERVREAALLRLEEKMTVTEGLQPKFDRRIAELSGNVKGLSDELQAQIRRVDLMDDRNWEWRHQLEEEVRHKYADIEQSVQKVASGVRVMAASVSNDQKRQQQKFQRFEHDLGERSHFQEETREALLSLCTRIEALEEGHVPHKAAGERGASSTEDLASATLYGLLDQRLEDLAERVERVFQDSHEVHARVAAQEEQFKTMRTLVNTAREDQSRALSDRDRGDWESKLEQLRMAVNEISRERLALSERVELLSTRLEYQEQEHDATKEPLATREAETAIVVQQLVEELQERVSEAEVGWRTTQRDLQQLRSQTELTLEAQNAEMMRGLGSAQSALQALDGLQREIATSREKIERERGEALQVPVVSAQTLEELRQSLQQEIKAAAAQGTADLNAKVKELGQLMESAAKGAQARLEEKGLKDQVAALKRTVEDRDEIQSHRLQAICDRIEQAERAFRRDHDLLHAKISAELKATGLLNSPVGRTVSSLPEMGDEVKKLAQDLEEMHGQLSPLLACEDLARSALSEAAAAKSSMQQLRADLAELKAARDRGGPGPTGGSASPPGLTKKDLDAFAEVLKREQARLEQRLSKLEAASHEDGARGGPPSPSQTRSVPGAIVSPSRQEAEEIPEGMRRELQRFEERLTRAEAAAKSSNVQETALLRLAQLAQQGERAASVSASARRQIEDLRKEIAATAEEGESLILSSANEEAVQRLQGEITTLGQRLDAFGGSFQTRREELLELALAVQQDEEAEAGAHQRLLERIDELCERLTEVSLSTLDLATGGSAGFPPELLQRFDALAARVEEMEIVSRQVQAQVGHFVARHGPKDTGP